ncbi:MAG: membrane protein insertion efficiency factor YidD [bacterium]|nr:membrane protein insertion efficiency factor YidD [bacterium]
MKKLVIFLIKLYQKYVSLLKGLIWPLGVCRFTPTCSTYLINSVEKYGVLKGAQFGFSRITRCNPFFQGGADPVP